MVVWVSAFLLSAIGQEAGRVAKKGELKAVMKTCIGFDAILAQKIKEASEQNERGWNQEVRYALRQYYGIGLSPAEDRAGMSVS
jgi:hypothetical protein